MNPRLERIDIPDDVVTRRLEKVGALYRLGRALKEVTIRGPVEELRPKLRER